MIIQAIIISSIVFFIFVCYREEMIFGFLNRWFKKKLPEKLWKPVFNCPFCMCPWYGSIIYWIFFHESILGWLLVTGTASGLITFFIAAYSIYIDIEHITEKYTEDKSHQKIEL